MGFGDQEVPQELEQKGKVRLSGIDDWQLLGDFGGELGDLRWRLRP